MPPTPHNPAAEPSEDRGPGVSVTVWDLPTRLFHWALVALVGTSFVTGDIGGTAMDYHEKSGVAILVLVLFRVAWGFSGGRHARFSAFVRGPAAVRQYAATLFKRSSSPHLGHNPLGGWSVLLMLAALLIQAGTGLFANDDILTEGPLFDLVSKQSSDWLTGIHLVNRAILAVLIGVHVAAIGFYLLFKKENLILPMISGKKTWPGETVPAGGPLWLAAAIFAVLAFAVYGLIY